MKIKITILIFVLAVSFLGTLAFADDTLNGVVVGGTQTPTPTGRRIDGTGNVEFVGDYSTRPGETWDIYAGNALLRSNAFITADGIYTLYGSGTLGMISTAGIVFGPNASVQAANIIISTLNIDSNNFFNPVNGERKFCRGKDKNGEDVNSAFIYNAGSIAARPGGYVLLLSQAINNSGTISVSSINANIGKVVLAVGEKMTVKMTVALDDKSQISVAVDEALQDTLQIIGPDGKLIDSGIKNWEDPDIKKSGKDSGKILAEGGKIVLTARVLNKIFDYAVNNTGVIQATNLVNNNGVVELVAEGPSPVLNTGTIEAGYIKVSVTGSDFINRGSLYAKIISGSQIGGDIDIKASNLIARLGKKILADRLVAIDVNTIVEVVYATDGTAVAASEADIVNAGEVISAPTVNITMRKLGTSVSPVYIKAANLYIKRLDGNIDISESLGIGTSILMRGPPEGFGSFIYSKDSNLTLDAARVDLVGTAPISFYGNITFSNLYCTVPGKTIYFEAGKTYTITGTTHLQGALAGDESINYINLLSSEKGVRWYIDPMGVHEVSYTYAEDSYNMDPRLIVGTSIDHDGNSYNWDADRYWISGTGNWNATSHWSASSGGISGASIPGSSDDVFFDNSSDSGGSSFTVTVTANVTVRSITISTSSANAVTLTVNNGKTLIISTAGGGSGTITLRNRANANTAATVTGTGAINCAAIIVGGTTAATGNRTTTLTSATSNLTISNDLSITSRRDSSKTNNARFNLDSGPVSVGGSVAFTTANNSNSIATLDMTGGSANGTLTLSSATPFTDSGNKGIPTFNANGLSATVVYSRSGAQTVRAVQYKNLTLSGSGAKSMATGTSVTGTLSIAPIGTATASVGAGLNLSVDRLTLGDLGRINGTWGSTSASAATYQNNAYFAATTGYLTVTADTRLTPTITTSPTASGITYGQALSASALSGGSASAPGSFAFTTSSTKPNAGTYSAPITFSPSDTTSYKNATGNVDVAVAKANAAIVVTPYTNTTVTYDGNTHTATGTAKGVDGVTLLSGLDLSGTTHTDAGTYAADTWTFTDVTGNYKDVGATVVADSIAKANAAIVVTPYTNTTVTYDGNTHTATGTAKGVDGVTLLSGLDLSGTTHTDAGTYTTDTWSFAGNTNYNSAGGAITDSIAKADATVSVTGYTGVYDAAAHGSTGTATGVGGVDLSGSLNLGATFTNVPGGTANWTFTDVTGNYNDQSGGVSITIIAPPAPPPPPANTALLAAITDQLSSLNAPRYPAPSQGQMTEYSPNTFNPQVGPVYFYHPLTPYDMAAFDVMILNASAYQFINGSIDLVGHEGLRSMFEYRRGQ
jgi:hypothetical protein